MPLLMVTRKNRPLAAYVPAKRLGLAALPSLVASDTGQDLVEYALLVMLIVIVVMVAIPPLGEWAASQFGAIAVAIPS